MKKDILKIAGVKSEAEFYKKFPSEEAFMKVHGKQFNKAKMGASMVKKQLTQLTDFANPPQAQDGTQQFGLQQPNFNYNVAAANEQMFGGYDFNKGLVDQYMPQVKPGEFANRTRNEVSASVYDTTGVPKYANSLGKTSTGASTTATAAKDPSTFSSVLNNAGDIYGGFQQAKQDRQNLLKSKQFNELSKVGLLATQSRPERTRNRYATEEDRIINPNELYPNFGTPANVLAKDGKKVRGNKTEIQNTYAPGSLYDNLGYEPLNDSAQNGGFFGNWQGDVKDFGEANAGSFGTMFGSAIGGGHGAPSGASKIGGGIGSIAGNAIGGPLGGVIGKGIGSLAGGIIGGAQQRRTENFNKLGMENVKQAAFQSGMQGMQQNQFGSFMEDGGEVGLKYLSHDWQPQIITKFGEYDVKDLLREDPTMDTLRSGGNITAQKGIGLLPSNPSGYADSVINANKNIQFYKDVLAKKAPEISQFPGMFSETEIRGMDDSNEQNPYVGSRTSVKPYFSYVSGKYIPIEGMKEAYEDKTIPGINFPSQYAASVFEEEMTKRTKKQRSGGHLKNYAPLSERAMSTERFAMGGELQTHWGGEAEPISYNPYLPDGGETVMFRGQSHEEADGQGRTGIGVTYGENPVEVERGEPAVKLKDGGEQESLVVYGNMKIPSYGVSELNDPLAKGKKFKNYANILSKKESKQNKIVEKGTNIIDDTDSDDTFESLKLNSAKAMVKGGNMKLKNYADKKILLSGIQNAILDTAKEMGVESDALSKGVIKQDKNSDMAKFGGKFTQAQSGILARPDVQPPNYRTSVGLSDPLVDRWSNLLQSVQNRTQPISSIPMSTYDANVRVPNLKTAVPKYVKDIVEESDASLKTANKRGKTTLDDILKGARTLLPYLRGTNQEAIDPNQLSGEMLALATNQLQPVQAQQYIPQLETPYSISFQDQMNANQADFNALQRQYGYNPAAASQLAAQKYAANSAILGQQARANQEMQMGVQNRNRAALNDSFLKNLAINDQQFTRQEQAKANTKQQAQVALNSIASKLAQHKLENRKLGIQENMYNYRFGPSGRAINENAPYEFDMEGSGNYAKGGMPTLPEGFEYKTTIQEKKKAKETARNGSIVKAIKNL